MASLKDGSSVFQSFVLTTQLRGYQVTVHHIQFGTMSILRGFDQSKTIRILLDKNAAVLKSFTKPADIRDIHWNMSFVDLEPLDYATIAITFATAQQANEAIEHGVLWNDERRECKRAVHTPGLHNVATVKLTAMFSKNALLYLVAVYALGCIFQPLVLVIVR